MKQEAVLEDRKQYKIAPGFFVSTLQKTARGQKERLALLHVVA